MTKLYTIDLERVLAMYCTPSNLKLDFFFFFCSFGMLYFFFYIIFSFRFVEISTVQLKEKIKEVLFSKIHHPFFGILAVLQNTIFNPFHSSTSSLIF